MTKNNFLEFLLFMGNPHWFAQQAQAEAMENLERAIRIQQSPVAREAYKGKVIEVKANDR